MDHRAAEVWADEDTPAVCLLTLGLDRYGVAAVNWAPQTWAQEIRDDAGVDLPRRNADRLAAACVLLVHPHDFYRSAATFTDIICGLAAEWFDTNMWHPPTAHECAWGVIESHLLHPPEKGEEFSPEVVRYVNMLVRNDGFRTLPRVFRTFGVAEDHSLPPPNDYSADPEMDAVVSGGASGLEKDLSKWVMDKLTDLADRLMVLPLNRRGDVKSVVEQLRAAAQTA